MVFHSLHGPAFSTALRSFVAPCWANLAGGRVAAQHVGTVADRDVTIQMLMDGNRTSCQGTAKSILFELPTTLQNGYCVVLGHNPFGLDREDPVQICARGAAKCGSFLCRRNRKLLVERLDILLA